MHASHLPTQIQKHFKNKTMNILENRTAVIYGGGGSLGAAVARAFAEAGARVFLTGRSADSLQKSVEEILKAGGAAETDVVDALDEKAIDDHIESVVKRAGSVDISFNAVGANIVMNIPLIDIKLQDFLSPITLAMQTHFLTAKASARVMMKQKSGVILTLTATPGGIGYPYTGGFAPACSALESFSRNLAIELGIYGVRVVNMRSGGSPDSAVFKKAIESNPEGMAVVLRQMEADTALKRLPSMSDIGNLAVFLASDMAANITGVTVDITSGTTAGLNYRATSST